MGLCSPRKSLYLEDTLYIFYILKTGNLPSAYTVVCFFYFLGLSLITTSERLMILYKTKSYFYLELDTKVKAAFKKNLHKSGEKKNLDICTKQS